MMPSTSRKQHNFMEAVAHNAAFAKKVGVPQSVGKEFSKADKGKTFKEGGRMATKMGKPMMKPGMDMAKDGMKKPTPMAPMGMKKGGMKKMAGGGLLAGHKTADGVASKGKTKGKKIVMSGNKGMKAGGYC